MGEPASPILAKERVIQRTTETLFLTVSEILHCHKRSLVSLVEQYLSFSFEDLSIPRSLRKKMLGRKAISDIRGMYQTVVSYFQYGFFRHKPSVLIWKNLITEQCGEIPIGKQLFSMLDRCMWQTNEKDILIVECIFMQEEPSLVFFDLNNNRVLRQIGITTYLHPKENESVLHGGWSRMVVYKQGLWFLRKDTLTRLRLRFDFDSRSIQKDLRTWLLPVIRNQSFEDEFLLNGYLCFCTFVRPSTPSTLRLWKFPNEDENEICKEETIFSLLPTKRMWIDGCYLYRLIDTSGNAQCHSLLSTTNDPCNFVIRNATNIAFYTNVQRGIWYDHVAIDDKMELFE